MRILKLGLISLFFLFIVIWLLSLLIPSTVRVSRAVSIESPKDSVKKKIQDIREWQKWNALLNTPQLTGISYSPTVFKSDQMSVTILPSDSINIIETQWVRTGQPPVHSGFQIIEAGNSCIVQWYFDFEVKWYPWEKFGSIVFDKELGPPMEKSLDQLKKESVSIN
ncbi:MAG: hypothetical protein H7Y31_14770 [Chitinophagaceae bacterium]|nr:hypothetical protein [Chitinophagaceae bacterium]